MILVVLCLLTATTVKGFQSKQGRPTGDSIVKGRVIFTDNGRPVRRVSIQLFRDLNHPAVRTTVSNTRGEFRFAGVAAGSYFVVPEGSGIVSHLSVFEINEFGLGGTSFQPVQVVVDGKNEKRVEVQAVRGASISGTITYSDKEPVKDARLTLFHRNGHAIIPVFPPPGLTNDRGMYRIDGLPAGDYFIGISDQRPSLKPMDPSPITNAYYPGVSNFSDAKPIHVEAGASATGINISLSEDRLREISGTVKWRQSGKPISGAVVTLRKKDEPKVGMEFSELMNMISARDRGEDDPPFRSIGFAMLTAPALVEVQGKGEWKFSELSPGDYVLTAYARFPPRESEEETDELASSEGPNPAESVELVAIERMVYRQIELTVGEEDLEDLVLDVSAGGRMSGVVIGEGAADEQVFVGFKPKESPDLLSRLNVQAIGANGSFLLDGISSGELQLNVEVIANSSLYVKSITAGSRDLMRDSLRVDDDTEITGVRITLGKGLATVNGKVLLKDGTPAAGNRVLLLRTDPKLWHLRTARLFAMTNHAGEFVVRGAPGEYMVFAWSGATQAAPTIEALVKSQAATVRRITLQPNDEQKIEFTITPPEK